MFSPISLNISVEPGEFRLDLETSQPDLPPLMRGTHTLEASLHLHLTTVFTKYICSLPWLWSSRLIYCSWTFGAMNDSNYLPWLFASFSEGPSIVTSQDSSIFNYYIFSTLFRIVSRDGKILMRVYRSSNISFAGSLWRMVHPWILFRTSTKK